MGKWYLKTLTRVDHFFIQNENGRIVKNCGYFEFYSFGRYTFRQGSGHCKGFKRDTNC